MKKLGIDESGRGSLIGPMIIGFSIIDERAEDYLKDIGVKDAKLLNRIQRDSIIKKIKLQHIEFGYSRISSSTVDKCNLNYLETFEFSKIISFNVVDKYYVDAFVPKNLINKLKGSIEYTVYNLSQRWYLNLNLYNNCESVDLSVALASIVARHYWDLETDKIRREVWEKFRKELGSLYTPDHRTLRFIRDHPKYPEIRKSFKLTGKNWEKIKNEKN